MSTVTPSRPAAPRPGVSRTRGPAGLSRTAAIDPFKVLRRHLLWIILAVLVGGALGTVAYVAFRTYYPLFTGQVLFEVQAGVRDVQSVGTEERMNDEDVHRQAETQLVLLSSRNILNDAVNDLDVQQKTTWFKDDFVDENGSPLIQDAVDELEEDLKTGVVRGTELFQIKWSTHRPADVPIVLNAIARAYMTARENLDNSVYTANLAVFRRQLESTNRDIEDLDLEIKAFIREKGIQSLDDPRYHAASIALNNITQRIAAAESELTITSTGYLQTAAKLEGRLDYSHEDLLEAEMDYAVTSHIRQVEAIKVELRLLHEKYDHDHPSVRAMESRLEATDAEKKAKIDEIVKRNLNAKLKLFADQIEQLQRVLDELEQEAEAKEAVVRELAAEQSQYDAMRGRREHLEETRNGDQLIISQLQLMRLRADAKRVRVAQWAQVPREMSFPRMEIIIPLGVLLLTGLTVGVIFLRELTDQRVKTAADLEILPGARVLGMIPDCQEDPTKCRQAELAVSRSPVSVLAESYRQACTPLTKAIDRAGYQSVVFIGGLPGAGTTTAITNVAAACAAAGRSVAVVDANFRRPRLAEAMGASTEQPGLGDLLAGTVSVEDVVQEFEGGLWIINAGSPPTRIIERLSGERFDALAAELRGRFDLVFFDVPPAVVAGDAMVLANKLDAAVLVIRAHQEQRGLVARLINQLADTQCQLVGILLNRPRGTAGGYFKKNFATMAAYGARD